MAHFKERKKKKKKECDSQKVESSDTVTRGMRVFQVSIRFNRKQIFMLLMSLSSICKYCPLASHSVCDRRVKH